MLSIFRGTRIEGYLNTAGDVHPGGANAQQAPGIIGQEIWLSDNDAFALTNPNGTTIKTTSRATALRNGFYRRVLSKAASTIAPAEGVAAYWDGNVDDLGNYIVTPDNNGGIILGYYLAAVTKGYYCWIQTSGVVWRKFTGTLTKVAASGDMVSNIAATGLADVLADATAVTQLSMQNFEGRALDTPTNGGLKRILVQRPFSII